MVAVRMRAPIRARAIARDSAIDWLHLSALRVVPPFGISSGFGP
jgi:hypothetical protein